MKTQHARSNYKNSGFNLLELLVVITVIGILIALIMVGLSNAKHKAREAKCQSNCRQMGVAMTSFVAMVGEFPLATNLARDRFDDHKVTYSRSLQEHLGGDADQLFTHGCPSAQMPSDLLSMASWADYGYNAHGVGRSNWNEWGQPYGLGAKGYPVKEAGGDTATFPVEEGAVVSPADMFAFGDGLIGDRDRLFDGSSLISRDVERSKAANTDIENRARARHRGAANIVFVDGHVERLTLRSIFQSEAREAYARWNRDNQEHREMLENVR